MIEKQWKFIPGFRNRYLVSNYGEVYSIVKNKLMEPQHFLYGPKRKYLYVTLTISGDKKKFKKQVHRLVAEAFIPNPNNLPQINHIDENQENNAIWNLEWCDSKYNNNYGTRNERIRNTHNLRKTIRMEKPVIQISMDGKWLKKYRSATDAEKQTGICHAGISSVARGKCKAFGGYKWQFAIQ